MTTGAVAELGRIAERLPQPVHRGVQPVVEVHERVGGPEVLPQFIAADDIAATAQQEQKDVEWPAAQLQRAALLAEVARPAVGLEQAEAIKTVRADAGLHVSDAEIAILSRMRAGTNRPLSNNLPSEVRLTADCGALH